MRRFYICMHLAPSNFSSALLYLLLLLTHCLIPPIQLTQALQLPFIEQTPTSRSPYQHHQVTQCAPSRQAVIGESPIFKCPCVLSFTASVPTLHQTPDDTIDFLVIPMSSHQSNSRPSHSDLPNHLRPTDYHPHHSSLRARLSAQSPNSTHARFHRHFFRVPQSAFFTIAIRTDFTHPQCNLTLALTYHTERPNCPVMLPPQLATPTPTPSPSATPSNSPSPIPTPTTLLPAQQATPRRATPRIVGGHMTHESFRTHMAAFSSGHQFICSGSLLSPSWVLTAAHCDINPSMRVTIGAHRLPDGEHRSVSTIIRHPKFQPSSDSPYDIALVRLSAPVSPDFRPVLININGTVPGAGEYARVSGYGQTSETAGFDEYLRQVDVPIVSMPECRRSYRHANAALANRLSAMSQICAGELRGGCDACHGDSGGPLAVTDKHGNLVQVGIVSFGIGCARAYLPGVYTKVSVFEGWIRDVGAGYTRSDGVVVESTFVQSANERSAFSIAGLSVTFSILVLCAVSIACVILIASLVLATSAWKRTRFSHDPRPDVDHHHDDLQAVHYVQQHHGIRYDYQYDDLPRPDFPSNNGQHPKPPFSNKNMAAI